MNGDEVRKESNNVGGKGRETFLLPTWAKKKKGLILDGKAVYKLT